MHALLFVIVYAVAYLLALFIRNVKPIDMTRVWCYLAGPEYRQAHRRLERIAESDFRRYPKRTEYLEIETGIRPAPPKWKTVSIGAKDHRGVYGEKYAPGPWAFPDDSSVMRRRYGPEREPVEDCSPVGHAGHVQNDTWVTGCTSCTKTYAVNATIKNLEEQKQFLAESTQRVYSGLFSGSYYSDDYDSKMERRKIDQQLDRLKSMP